LLADISSPSGSSRSPLLFKLKRKKSKRASFQRRREGRQGMQN
jgi:hypothetical protein